MKRAISILCALLGAINVYAQGGSMVPICYKSPTLYGSVRLEVYIDTLTIEDDFVTPVQGQSSVIINMAGIKSGANPRGTITWSIPLMATGMPHQEEEPFNRMHCNSADITAFMVRSTALGDFTTTFDSFCIYGTEVRNCTVEYVNGPYTFYRQPDSNCGGGVSLMIMHINLTIHKRSVGYKSDNKLTVITDREKWNENGKIGFMWDGEMIAEYNRPDVDADPIVWDVEKDMTWNSDDEQLAHSFGFRGDKDGDGEYETPMNPVRVTPEEPYYQVYVDVYVDPNVNHSSENNQGNQVNIGTNYYGIPVGSTFNNTVNYYQSFGGGASGSVAGAGLSKEELDESLDAAGGVAGDIEPVELDTEPDQEISDTLSETVDSVGGLVSAYEAAYNQALENMPTANPVKPEFFAFGSPVYTYTFEIKGRQLSWDVSRWSYLIVAFRDLILIFLFYGFCRVWIAQVDLLMRY